MQEDIIKGYKYSFNQKYIQIPIDIEIFLKITFIVNWSIKYFTHYLLWMADPKGNNVELCWI